MISSVAQPAPSDLLRGSPFVSYVYSYPHKTAYRPLEPIGRLSEVWRDVDRRALFLYVHVPFCEFRCGFCNLFTQSQPGRDLPQRYLQAVRRQAEAVIGGLEDVRFARLAIGGGTPTFLSVEELEELFALLVAVTGVCPREIPVSLEASPVTVSLEKLALLREYGVDRLSLGVQSFENRDARAMGRPQRREDVERALESIRAAGFPTLNIDLIYGGEGQTMSSWLESVECALAYQPEELYLYPIYVRPLTGLGQLAREWDDWRLAAYREARRRLLDLGYRQVSFRMFRAPHAASEEGPVYCCQEDGMIGLGCGARSYTPALHYSCEYAVGSRAVAGILADFVSRDAQRFARVDYGFPLDGEDQRRRYAIISLLQAAGLLRADYARRFARDPLEDLPQLKQLELFGLAETDSVRIRLTPAGLERSDAIGPWLFSRKVRQRMETYQWR